MSFSLRDIAKDLLAGKRLISEAELASERIKTCEKCPSFRPVSRQCALCHCFLDLKTKIVKASCPINKW